MNKLINKVPATGIKGLRDHWKEDLVSGFMISLIALPLCLGISIASGVPPMAGLLTAIVGGMLMSRITGSFVTISGPAAGLIVVTLGAVESLGLGDPKAGYHYALAAIVVAGVIQFGFGLLKAGKLGDFFPSAAVHGMLAAIGIIIMVKQFFVAIGTKAEGHELFEVIAEIPSALLRMNPDVALIAASSLIILIIHPYIKYRFVKMIPAPMWVLIFAIPMSHYFDLFHEHHYNFMGHDYELGPKYLVHLPNSIAEGIVFPDFGKVLTGAFWIAVISITLVSSIESLLSAAAVDTIDPYKRKSNLNKDIGSMGIGSALSGLIGGLPMISEIVRSSANISNGGKTQWANFFHGSFLLLFLLFGKPIIEQIPLAALAAMLIHVGFKLASPSEFRHVWEIGKEQLLIFVITLVTVLATDLIIGIGVGIVAKMIIHLFYGVPLNYLFKINTTYDDKGNKGILHLKQSAIFSNFLSMKAEIEKHTNKNHLVLDFEKVNLIDHTFRTRLHMLKKEWEKEGRQLEFINKEHLIPVSNHPLAAKKASQNSNGKARGYTLNKHQQKLQLLATDLGWELHPQKVKNFNDINDLSIENVGQLIHIQNKIIGTVDSTHYTYMEVVIDKDISSKATDTLFPILLIKNEYNYPIFTLEKEDFFHKLQELTGLTDIDFKDHPEFSRKYLLKGEIESKTRNFFNKGIIELFEIYNDYHFESNGEVLLIYRFDNSSNPGKVSDLINFGKKLNGLIKYEEMSNTI